jgi:hypothetical protein
MLKPFKDFNRLKSMADCHTFNDIPVSAERKEEFGKLLTAFNQHLKIAKLDLERMQKHRDYFGNIYITKIL